MPHPADRSLRALCLVLLLVAAPAVVRSGTVVVYGATGGGFSAAIAAARAGATATILLATGSHIGGMVTGGLQHTDVGNASVLGGVTLEFFERVERSYPGRPVDPAYPPGHSPSGWLFESHVAEAVMVAMLQEANVTVVRNVEGIARVDREKRSGGQQGPARVQHIVTVAGGVFPGDVFIDASYEGDLLALAGATMTWGRESQATYGEPGGGRRSVTGYANFGSVHLSPYWDATAKPPVPLPHVSTAFPGDVGDGDKRITAYDYRLCMTNSPGNRVLVQQPAGYNASEWELWRRYYAITRPTNLGSAGLHCLGPIPNSYDDCGASACLKCDMIGGGPLSTDFIGGSYAYPNATSAVRRTIVAAHVGYTQGLLWFLATDPGVPAGVRQDMATFGLCKDEYNDTTPPHWPHQLYVREARRLVGDWVFTAVQPDAAQLERSIGAGSYVFDCHQVQRTIHFTAGGDPADAYVVNEGEIEAQFNGSGSGVAQTPYRIPFDTLLPRRSELPNVVAAVPVSASHVRFSSLRMEPTWMVMGQAAGVAAVMAANHSVAVQDVDVATLQDALLAAGQIIWV